MNYTIINHIGSGFQASVYETDRHTVVKRFRINYFKDLIKQSEKGKITLKNNIPNVLKECENAKFASDIGIGPTIYEHHFVTINDNEYIDLEMDKINIVFNWNDVSESQFIYVLNLFKRMMEYGFLVLDGQLGYYDNKPDEEKWRIVDYGVVSKYNVETQYDRIRFELVDDYIYLINRDNSSPLSVYLQNNL